MAPVTGADEMVTRLWLRPFLDHPRFDVQEQAILAPDGWIAVFRAEPYRVDWLTPSGKWLLGAALVLPVLAMDQREEGSTYRGCGTRLCAAGNRNRTSLHGWGGTVELFSGPNLMIPTPDSGVLIRRRPIADARGTLYDFVDRGGKLMRELEISGAERIIGFGPASAYVFVSYPRFPRRWSSERHPCAVVPPMKLDRAILAACVASAVACSPAAPTEEIACGTSGTNFGIDVVDADLYDGVRSRDFRFDPHNSFGLPDSQRDGAARALCNHVMTRLGYDLARRLSQTGPGARRRGEHCRFSTTATPWADQPVVNTARLPGPDTVVAQ